MQPEALCLFRHCKSGRTSACKPHGHVKHVDTAPEAEMRSSGKAIIMFQLDDEEIAVVTCIRKDVSLDFAPGYHVINNLNQT